MNTSIEFKSSLRKPEKDLSLFLDKKAEKNIQMILNILGLKGFNLSVSFVGDKAIRSMNRMFRKKNKPTDVLSFPMYNFHPKPSIEKPWQNQTANPILILGDLVICPKIAKKQAQDIGQTLEKEMIFLMIHGILHLCGYDHMNPKEEKIMIRQQKQIFAALKQGR